MESHLESGSSSSRSFSPYERRSPSPGTFQQYDDLMKDLLPFPPGFGSVQSVDSDDDDNDNNVGERGGKPTTKAEKQNAKKRRRKERERLAKLADVENASNGMITPRSVGELSCCCSTRTQLKSGHQSFACSQVVLYVPSLSLRQSSHGP